MNHPILALLDVGTPELLLIMFAILILFGGERLPSLARGLGKSIREFKKASAGVEEEIRRAIETAPEPQARPQPAPPAGAVAATPRLESEQKPVVSAEPESQLEPESEPNVHPSIKDGPHG